MTADAKYQLTDWRIAQLAAKLEDYYVDATNLDATFIAELIKSWAEPPQQMMIEYADVFSLENAVIALLRCRHPHTFTVDLDRSRPVVMTSQLGAECISRLGAWREAPRP